VSNRIEEIAGALLGEGFGPQTQRVPKRIQAVNHELWPRKTEEHAHPFEARNSPKPERENVNKPQSKLI
jgi:hypothetical protein